ncbi:putative disease resistance RPP8-like protein 4 [Acorus calamus]|uniref:Disease resistance RPP8-like protein 4 n=1 Tax=Acorus calamus TaxID=4465 RepID=A0AAV9DXL6_ACOCL|nr:putative disease resistance RPP8-like protein 4 [Acorus calamus]
MHNLRHLCCHSIFYSHDPRRMRFDSLKNLQTLRSVCSGEWIDRGLSKLTNLRRLALYHKFKESFHPALPDRLSKLVHLNQLSLSGHSTLPALCSFRNHHHLTKLSFIIRLERLQDVEEHPPNLRKLKLRGSELKEDPMPVLEKLENLHILSFDNVYIGQKMWCSARGFPCLEVLILWKMHHLEEWTIEVGALSRLKRLEINDCRNLKMLPEGLQHVTTLGEVELMWMSEEFLNRVQMNTGCDWYKIRHVPRINIEGTDIYVSDKDEDSEGIKPKKNRITTYIR